MIEDLVFSHWSQVKKVKILSIPVSVVIPHIVIALNISCSTGTVCGLKVFINFCSVQ